MVYHVSTTSCKPIKQANLFLGLSYTHAGGSTGPLSPQLTGNLVTYGHKQQLVLSLKGKDIASAAVQLIEGRDALGPEAQSRLDNAFLQAATTMLQTAQRNDALAQLPISNPGPVSKKAWRKKKAHGPADAAGLTSAEIARRDLLAKEKAERAANRAANHAPESSDEEDPGLLPPSIAPQGWRNLAARRGRVEGP
jgi:hypothetical protein